MAIPAVGDKITDAELMNIEGNKFKISSFNDKFILLDFWSLTCFTCMTAAKEIQIAFDVYKEKLNIVGINMDADIGMWQQGTNRDNIRWYNLSDGMGSANGIGGEYGIFGFPSYVLISPEGIIVDRWMGHKPGRLEEKLKLHIS